MSEYFRTLNRMEREQGERDTPLTSESPAGPEKGQWHAMWSSRYFSRDETASFATLFDSLRALANGRPVRSLVLAGASSFESVHKVTEGLVDQFTCRKLSVLVAKVTESEAQPILRLANSYASGAEGADLEPKKDRAIGHASLAPLPLNLRGGPVTPELTQWLESACTSHGLTIIEGPPLGQSLDAAMVAQACDGLVVVVEPEATPEKALQAAVERAQAAGCRVLGLVISGTRDYTPKWLRQLRSLPAG